MKALPLVVASVIAAGCNGAPTAPAVTRLDPPVAVAPPADYEGLWTGQTDQAQPLTFSIAGNQINTLDFKFTYAGSEAACPGSVSGGFGGSGSLGAISNGAFSITDSISTGDGLHWTMAGAFVSSTTARGVIDIRLNSVVQPACVISVKAVWLATKS